MVIFEVHIIQNCLDLIPEFFIIHDEHMLICFDVLGMYVHRAHTVDYGLSHSQTLTDWGNQHVKRVVCY